MGGDGQLKAIRGNIVEWEEPIVVKGLKIVKIVRVQVIGKEIAAVERMKFWGNFLSGDFFFLTCKNRYTFFLVEPKFLHDLFCVKKYGSIFLQTIFRQYFFCIKYSGSIFSA